MAHPDEGYLIPDDEWSGLTDPDTGENFYPEDPFARYRLALIRYHRDRAGLTRAGHEQRKARLERLRKEALRGGPAPEVEESDD
jgi:hypothetical protein